MIARLIVRPIQRKLNIRAGGAVAPARAGVPISGTPDHTHDQTATATAPADTDLVLARSAAGIYLRYAWSTLKTAMGLLFAAKAHKTQHATGGADALAASDIGALTTDHATTHPAPTTRDARNEAAGVAASTMTAHTDAHPAPTNRDTRNQVAGSYEPGGAVSAHAGLATAAHPETAISSAITALVVAAGAATLTVPTGVSYLRASLDCDGGAVDFDVSGFTTTTVADVVITDGGSITYPVGWLWQTDDGAAPTPPTTGILHIHLEGKPDAAGTGVQVWAWNLGERDDA
jgi:hypothetical protein